MQAHLIIYFDQYNEPDFLLRAETIAPSLVNNQNFPTPWPAAVPDPGAITTAVTSYGVAYKNAAGGDKTAIKVRSGLRTGLATMFRTTAHYLEIVANGDVAKLATTGYDLRKDIVKSLVQTPLDALTDLRVKRTALSGGLLVHAKANRRADVYHVQVAFADPAVEANWGPTLEFVHCNRIELDGLTPQKTYYVRIRGFNKNGPGVWATSAGILVL
jgi:hypothetical protein